MLFRSYTGSAITPTLTVKDGDKTLTKDTDYTVSYSDNTEVGTATATVIGKGLYIGTVTDTALCCRKAMKRTVSISSRNATEMKRERSSWQNCYA